MFGELDLAVKSGDGRTASDDGERFLGSLLFRLSFLQIELESLFEAVEAGLGGGLFDGGELDHRFLMLNLLRGDEWALAAAIQLLKASEVVLSLPELRLGKLKLFILRFDFGSAGIKWLMLRYAHLQKL